MPFQECSTQQSFRWKLDSPKMADLLGSILSSMEKPPTVHDQESRRKAREQAARLKKIEEDEKRKKAEFRKRMEKEVSDFIQDSTLQKKKYNPMGKIERSILHDVAEVAGLTSFSFGEDEESRYVMLFKKEFAPSDEELEAYRKGEEWDPQKAEERRRLKEQAALEMEEASHSRKRPASPNSNYRDKYSHLIGTSAAKDAAHTLQANRAYGCVPVANKRDTRSIEEAMNEIRAKKRQKKGEEEGAGSGSSVWNTSDKPASWQSLVLSSSRFVRTQPKSGWRMRGHSWAFRS
ncbi:hypothetical protein QQF64_027041 [Cirrhinus molitorella]|uniref:R3H domain-containing protein n=1 Tax=Cirrhinus molitorella TaxID=172907 RepID=A0ABR3NBV8_9TELE